MIHASNEIKYKGTGTGGGGKFEILMCLVPRPISHRIPSRPKISRLPGLLSIPLLRTAKIVWGGGAEVSEFHPLPTFSVEPYPPCAKSSLLVYPAAGVVPSFTSRVCAAFKNEPNVFTLCKCVINRFIFAILLFACVVNAQTTH